MNPPGLLQRIAGAVLGLALFVSAIVFASVILALVATLAAVAWGWLWWRTRNLKRQAQGVVIDGEYRVERETARIEERER